MIIGTSQTWAYINSQLDRGKKYAVHIGTPGDESVPLCKRGARVGRNL